MKAGDLVLWESRDYADRKMLLKVINPNLNAVAVLSLILDSTFDRHKIGSKCTVFDEQLTLLCCDLIGTSNVAK